MRELFASFLGEFGHELFCFQGVLRARADRYDRIVIASRRGRGLLYNDFFTTFVPIDNAGTQTSGSRCLDYKYNNFHKRYVGKDADVIKPGDTLVRYVDRKKWQSISQSFVTYGKKIDTDIDFLVHARDTNKLGSDKRNWDHENWELLLSRLKQEKPDLVIGAIGSSDGAYKPHSAIDLRDISLSDLANYMHSTKFIVGPSSGPMHFASLCLQKRIVWDEDQNSVRHEIDWNPFEVPVDFIGGGWNPDIETVYERIIDNI